MPLAQEFVNRAYSTVLSYGFWLGTYKDSGFFIPASYNTGTVQVVQGSAVVLGTGTTWTSAMVGRQFLLGPIAPFYDILSVDSPTQITLASPFIGASATLQPYAIQLRLVTCPSDFMNFVSVVDPVNNWQLNLNYTQEKIDKWDARRTVGGTPRVLAGATQTTTGLLRYEIWPQTQTNVSYPFRYRNILPLLSAASDRPIFPIRGDVLRDGALAELCLWPGLATAPNPYYNLQQHKMMMEKFWKGIYALELENQNQSQTAVDYTLDSGLPYAPIDANYIQSHGGW